MEKFSDNLVINIQTESKLTGDNNFRFKNGNKSINESMRDEMKFNHIL